MREAIAGQIEYINQQVVDVSRQIVETNDRPAVVVAFSDHGYRHKSSDRDEMFHSLILTRTPGQPGLFPDDSTPINILPRILNGYSGAEIELASEESYWIPLAGASDGFFPLEPWTP